MALRRITPILKTPLDMFAAARAVMAEVQRQQAAAEASSTQPRAITPTNNGPTAADVGDQSNVTPALYYSPQNSIAPQFFVTPTSANEQAHPDQTGAQETADAILEAVDAGRSIDLIAEEQGKSRDEVIAELEAAGYTVETTDPVSDNGDVRTTTITDPQGNRTVTEYYDFHHGTYHTAVTENGGEEVHGPQRDGRGWKVEEHYDSDTRITTTRYEDDLGDGTVVEETRLPSGVVTRETTTADGDTTVVVISDGQETELSPDQDPTREGTASILEDVIAGKSIATIAEERGLTEDQVIAQLEAAGYEINQDSTTDQSGTSTTTEIVDPETGKVVAGYYFNSSVFIGPVVDESSRPGSETRTVRYVDENGSEVERTTSSNGTVTETVTDTEGRRTETTTVPGANGDSQETVEVTFNGYTLTTEPDGGMVLRDNEDGTEIEIEPGSLDETLARTLLSINPQSSNPAQAAEDEIVMTVIEGMFSGKTYEDLLAEAGELRAATEAAIEEHGLGPEAQPTIETDEDGDITGINFQGEPPAGLDPTVDWVPMKVEGTWRWVHPEVARAIAAENVVLGEVMTLQAEMERIQAQLDVWALDPAVEEAMEAAGATLDEALGEHGYRWVRPEPEGDLAAAQQRLSDANGRVTNAQDALAAYEESQRLLGEAITKQENMPFYPDGETPVITSADSNYNYQEEYRKGQAAHAEVDALLSQANYQRTLGDSLVTDLALSDLESQFGDGVEGLPEDVEPVEITVGDETVQVAPEVAEAYEDDGLAALTDGGQPVAIQRDTDGDGTLEWLWIDAETATSWLQLKVERDALGRQLEIDGAYADLYQARSDLAAAQLELGDISQRLLAEYNSDNPQLFENSSFQGNEIIDEDGQLWVVNHFEHGETKYQLTWENPNENYRYYSFSEEWQTFQGTQPNADICVAGNRLEILQRAEQSAGETVNRTLEEQLDVRIEDLGSQIDELEAEYNNLLEEHGTGTIEPPGGSFPDGVEPVRIDIGDRSIYVHPDVADGYEANGLEALTASDAPVQVEIDTDGDGEADQMRWVDPSLAYSWLALELAQDMYDTLESTRDIARSAADWLAFQRTQPVAPFNETGRREHLQGLESAYFEERRGDVLANVQQQIGSLYDQGYDETFRPFSDETIIEALHLDTSTEEGRDVLGKVTSEIRDIGGDDAEVRVVPVFYVDPEDGIQQMALFAVRNGDGAVRYVDVAGKVFDSVEDFQDNNSLFSEHGHLIVPTGFQMTPGSDGEIALDVVKARNVTAWDKVVDPLVGIGTAVASFASLTPAAPIAAPLAIAGGTYLGTRAAIRQYNHIQHGGEWGETESLMNMAMIATTALPMASGGLRSIGMARSLNLTKGQAFLAGIGAVRTTGTINAAANSTRLSRLWHSAPHMRQVSGYMRSTEGLNLAALTLDGSAMVIGAPLMYVSAKDLAQNFHQMSGLQIADAITGLATGLAGTGMGAAGFASYARARSQGIPTFRFTDDDGHTISAFAYGEPPTSGDRVYIPPADGPRLRGDDPSVAGKTHILVRDAETGDAAVVPWIRGASSEHTPPPSGAQPPASAPTAREVRGLTLAEIPMLTDSYLTSIKPRHLSQLRPDQIEALTPAQVGKLTYDQIASLRPKQLRALGTEQLQAISPSQLEAIAPGRIAQLKPRQVGDFTPEQIAALTPDQTAKVTVDQWRDMDGAQLQSLSSEQLATLTDKKVSRLSSDQVAAFLPQQLEGLTPRQVGAFKAEHFNALSKEQLRAFTAEQLQAISPATIPGIDRATIRKFAPRQIAALSLAQLRVFTSDQAGGLRPSQKLRLSPEQTSALSIMEPKLTFGYTAALMGTAAFLAMPPHIRAPIAATAYGLRGVSMILRAGYPDKTRPNQPLGRTLRGVEAVTFMPNIASGIADFPNAPFVNGSYQIGNVMYAGKAIEELRTGKSAFPETDKVALPLYVAGSVEYLRGPTGEVIGDVSALPGAAPDLVGGGLFAYGSAHLLYDAWRPSTTKNGNPTLGPRIVLGVTFGGGLLTFSAMAWANVLADDGSTPSPTDDSTPQEPLPAPEETPTGPESEETPGVSEPEDSSTQPQPEDPPAETEPESSPTEPEEPETPAPQLVVISDEGLNLREGPGSESEVITVLRSGALIQETGERRTDKDGHEWAAVTGFGPDGEQHEGWVDASFVNPHAGGAQDANGRFNPQLESEGYAWVIVEPGQSIGSIARSHQKDVADTVVLNMDHIHNPHVIFAGDRIYLPGSAAA